MAYAVTAVMAAAVIVAGGTTAWLVRYRQRIRRQPEPYELHRSRWERSGDVAELEAMKNEIGRDI